MTSIENPKTHKVKPRYPSHPKVAVVVEDIAANAGEIVRKTQSPPIVQVNKYQQNLVFMTVNLLSLPFFFTRRNKNKPRRTAHIHTKETNNRPLKSISGLLKIANPRTARYDIEPVRSK